MCKKICSVYILEIKGNVRRCLVVNNYTSGSNEIRTQDLHNCCVLVRKHTFLYFLSASSIGVIIRIYNSPFYITADSLVTNFLIDETTFQRTSQLIVNFKIRFLKRILRFQENLEFRQTTFFRIDSRYTSSFY